MKPQEASSFSPKQFQQLKKLVAHGEGLTLEFKRKAAFPDKIVREMIAFANTKGGILLIGIDDDGSIPGLKHPEDDSHVVRQALKKCRPALKVHETFIPISSSRTIIQYEIPESKKRSRITSSTEKNRIHLYAWLTRVFRQAVKYVKLQDAPCSRKM